MNIRRMCIARWITKAINTHPECVILIDFSWQQWLRELASILRLQVQYLSCSIIQGEYGGSLPE